MSKDSDKQSGCASWIKWGVGVFIALLGAGVGIVALLNYLNPQEPPPNFELTREAQVAYEQAVVVWEKFSPPSLSGKAVEAILRGADAIDLDSGSISSNPQAEKRNWDLRFICGPNGEEALRASEGASWFERGVVVNFDEIKYRDIRDASYSALDNSATGYPDLYYVHKSNAPGAGFVYFIKTSEGRVAKLQITGYEIVDNNPLVCRNMTVKYEVFPVVNDPPKPVR